MHSPVPCRTRRKPASALLRKARARLRTPPRFSGMEIRPFTGHGRILFPAGRADFHMLAWKRALGNGERPKADPGMATFFVLQKSQSLPVALETAWDFFSDPANLPAITPPDLGFKVLSRPPARIYPGLMLRYSVR